MRATIFSAMMAIVLGLMVQSFSATAQQTEGLPAEITTEFKVLGLCGMCKERIEKAAFSVRGVRTASWDQKKQSLTVSYRTNRADQPTIERAIAKAGHDTQNFITDAKTHANLHGCCKYPRDPEMLKTNKLYNQD